MTHRVRATLRTVVPPWAGAICSGWIGLAGVLHGQTPDPSADSSTAQPLGAPASFSAIARDVVEIPGGATLLHAPTPSASVAFEFPSPNAEKAEVLERRETVSGVWVRVRFGGIYGWFQESSTELDQIAALYENPSRLERRARLSRVAQAHVEAAPVEVAWTLSDADRTVQLPVRVFADLDRRSMRTLRELIECVPGLYAARFGVAVPSRSLPIDVFVFPDEDDYDRFAAAELATSIQESGGLEIDGLVFVNGDTTTLTKLGTVAHELTHVLNRFGFSEGALPVWLEEGIAEDIAHSVEAAVVAGSSPCARPGGWARTRVRETTEFVDGKATQRTDLQRTGRGRMLLCYSGRGPDDPDVRDLTSLEFGASYRRDVLYLEAALLVRDLLSDVGSAMEARAMATHWRRENDQRQMDEVADRVLSPLPWRVTERSWMRCR